jgi:hypothetical protein
MTRVARSIAGRTIAVICESGQEALTQDLITTIERMSQGAPRAGMRIRFGWSVLTLREADDGGLIVCEPDFDGDALRETRPRVDVTLDVVARQAALIRRLGVEPVDVGFDQLIVAARGAFTSRTLLMFRASPSGDDSGWSLTIPEDQDRAAAPDNFEAVRAYTLLRGYPEALTVLPLPPGFAVVIEDRRISVILDENGRART